MASDPPPRVLLVCGYGSGISAHVARRFGKEGFRVAIVSRNQEKLDAAVKELKAEGITAAGLAADLTDPDAVAAVVSAAAAALGGNGANIITVLHWNPFNSATKPLLEMTPGDVDTLMGTTVKGLLAAVQAALPFMEHVAASGAAAAAATHPPPAVLVTGGGLSLDTDAAAAAAVAWDAAGIGLAKAAQRKLVALLRADLAPRGVRVGEVTVRGVVRGSKWEDEGRVGEVDAADVAGDFWTLYASPQSPAPRWLLRDRDTPPSPARLDDAAVASRTEAPALALSR